MSSLLSARQLQPSGDIDDGMRSGLISVVELPGTASGLCDADNSRGRRRSPRRLHLANTQKLVDFYAGLTNVQHGISVGRFRWHSVIRERIKESRRSAETGASGE